MALVRLAGVGLKNLLGVGAKEAGKRTLMQQAAGIGAGLAADAAIVGGGTALASGAYDALTGGSGLESTERRIISEGPNLRTNQYNIGLGDQIQSGVSRLFGGQGITQEGLKELDELTKFKAITDDPKLKAYARKKGINLDDYKGKTLNDVNAILGPDMAADAALTAAQLKDDIYTKSTQYTDAKSAAEEAKQYRYFTDAENRRRDDQARLDRRADSQANLDYRMADLSARKQIAQDNYNLEVQKMNRDMKNDKKARIAQALAGLGSLGMMFAV